MSDTRYRITWEMPGRGDFDCVGNLKPNHEWHTTVNETDDPWQQYEQLMEWSLSGEEPIRNVKLERATITWSETFIPEDLFKRLNELKRRYLSPNTLAEDDEDRGDPNANPDVY